MELKKKLPREKSLRDDDYIRVLLTGTRNGLVMKVDDPCSEIVTADVYELDNYEIDDDLDHIDPEKVQKFIYDLMDVLCIHPSERAKKKLSVVVEDRKDEK